MRLISFLRPDGTASYGTTDGTTVHDAGAELSGTYADLRAVLAAGAISELSGRGPQCALDEVTLLSPVPNPDKIICIGLNYMSHIKETGRDKPTYPSIFTRYPSSIVGHGTPLVRPKVSDKFDYEGELAVIIGKACRHVSTEAAQDVIAGYTCFNDGSIRDFQVHTTQFWPGKSFEASGAMGPWIATADEVGDVTKQTLTTRINGNVEQQAGIDDLAITIPEMIAYLSQILTLQPGDVIATGTPGGVGRFREPQLYLEPGMTAEIEITGIGTLSNGIVDEA
ncbi:fumarylacetoacetate hydrolase family protein [uncultured Maritimibacter sp.]|jgi:2-keto-4-pentenoate hydratase/2-oxohepta-3-ene-1,7-dioic acid hydratase in catechol pathway|uniref:fumarylacetoacetate hydrolase family protein n=1 Tax=uncultured Maritimibacter sp. TaxID=991866 RepID=UPI000AE18E25|nr:fumarylacetoacetate hydrolase family protein [uncultured Maritimibacter sp.]